MADATSQFNSPVLLTENHDLSAFDSGEAVLDDWLRQRAWSNLLTAASRTYVVCPVGSISVSGYYALSMGQILARDVTGAMRRNMPSHIPAVILGRLTIEKNSQGQGLGQGLGRILLGDATRRSLLAAKEVSARLLVIHAISPQAEAFYLHHGFTRLPVETPTFAVDLVKLQKTS